MTRVGQLAPVQRPSALGKAEARSRAALVTDVRYRIVLDVTANDQVSTVTVIDFDASNDAGVFVDYAGTPMSVECNGHELDGTTVDGSRIHLSVRRGGNRVRITGVAPYGNAGVGLHRFCDPLDGQVYLHTKFQPFDAHRVYPCFDQPDIRATFEVTVVADAAWHVVSNTPVRSRTVADGAATWSFEPTLPIATYLTAIAAGPLERRTVPVGRSGVPIRFFARPSLIGALDGDVDELAGIIDHGLGYFGELFGEAYPFGKLDVVFAPEYTFGAMEHPGAITANERFVFTSRVTEESRRRRSEVLLHELAHMWFGNLVAIRWWDDLWLSESFAVWAAAHAQAGTDRFASAWTWFAHDAVVTARHADSLPARQPVALDADDTTAARLGFTAITYRKGAALLRQLARQLGEKSFTAGLRRYVNTHAWGNADLTDLVAAMDAESGMDVTAWAETWLRRSGVNTVTAGSSPGVVRLVQQPDAAVAPRAFPLDVDTYTLEGGRLNGVCRLHAEITGSDPVEVAVPVGGPAPEVVIPNTTGTTYVKVSLDDRSRLAVLDQLPAIADATSRAVVWSSLWEDVKDARLPAGRFVTSVMDHAAAEPEDGIVELLWTRAITAAQDCGDPRSATRRTAHLHQVAAGLLATADPGSDRQLIWARLAVAALSAEHAGTFASLLPGSSPYPGLAVDNDLTWRYLHRLAVLGRCADDHLAAAAEADPSWDGHLRALAVRAARPSDAAKRESWEFAADESRSIAERRAAMAGIQQHGQERLLEPYVQRYFDSLLDVWDAQEAEVGIAFARLLYPRITADPLHVSAETDRILAHAGTPVEVAAILRDEQAELIATEAARRCDRRAT